MHLMEALFNLIFDEIEQERNFEQLGITKCWWELKMLLCFVQRN